jgi:hypothetical protein
MEIWGLCGGCRRWFYCEGWFYRERDEPTCPVCGGTANAIENRAALQVRTAPSGDLAVT